METTVNTLEQLLLSEVDAKVPGRQSPEEVHIGFNFHLSHGREDTEDDDTQDGEEELPPTNLMERILFFRF